LILVIQKIALGFEVIWSRHINRKSTVKECEKLFLHHSVELTGVINLIGWPPAKQSLFDETQFVAG
jgi:hypothetical protein